MGSAPASMGAAFVALTTRPVASSRFTLDQASEKTLIAELSAMNAKL